MSAVALPDDLWRLILEIGIRSPNPSLTYKDICSLSLCSRRFRRLSTEDSLWSLLLSYDFPPPPPPASSSSAAASSQSSPYKSLYRFRWWERDHRFKSYIRSRATWNGPSMTNIWDCLLIAGAAAVLFLLGKGLEASKRKLELLYDKLEPEGSRRIGI